jgi:hypothetical protein
MLKLTAKAGDFALPKGDNKQPKVKIINTAEKKFEATKPPE